MFGVLTRHIHPDDLNAFFASVTAAVASRSPWKAQARFIKPSGETVWLEGVSEPVLHGDELIFTGVIIDITARKRAEEALKESEEFNRGLVENLPDYIVVYGPDGNVLYVNPASATALGYTAGELTGKPVLSYVTDDYRDVVRAKLASRKNIRDIPPYEIAIVRKDGLRRSVIVKGTCIQYHDIPATLLVLVDITERSQAEEALRESEEKFRSIFDAINDGIEIHEFEPGKKPGKFLVLNDVACRMLQYTREELLQRGPFDFVTGYHSRPLDEILGELETTGHSIFETEHRRKDGTIVPVEINVHIGHLQGKRVAISVVRDITERKLAEKVLQEEEAKYRRIYETSLEGIWGVDTGYRVIFVNPKMANMLGYPPEEILGHAVSDFVALDEKDEAVQLFEHHRMGLKEQFERRYVRKDGTIITLLVSASPVYGEGGKFTGSFAMFTDITERKQAEKALRQANRKLNLLTGITRHDILNKIAIVVGFLRIVQMKAGDPEIADYLNKIDSAIEAIKSQIEFTRVYQDLGTHEPQWLALDGVMPRSHVPATVSLKADGQGILLFADPLLEKVFSNLLDNSVRHGQRVNEIRVSSYHSGKDLVVVWEDNGIGIPSGDKERIFERGFGKNTGLGMFLAREILSLTGITIKENGEPGKGARFKILVPEGSYRIASGT